MSKLPISIMILTYNEEANLEYCLRSVTEWASEIFLVDSNSTDNTLSIARQYNCDIVAHTFEGHTKQRNWGLRNLSFENEWVMALDADHRITPELAAELFAVFQKPPTALSGFFMKRRQIFRGHWIRHGGYYPKWQLKLFRHAKARCDDQEFDYRYYVDGSIGYLKCDILEDNRKEYDMTFWITKHNKFATETAEEEIKRRDEANNWLTTPRLLGNPDQRVLWLKTLWYRFPLYVRPFMYFFYRYFVCLGILDGKQGFIFHFMQAFWFRLLVDIKLDDLIHPQTPKVES